MDLGVLLPAVAANEAAVTANDAATANEAGIEEIRLASDKDDFDFGYQLVQWLWKETKAAKSFRGMERKLPTVLPSIGRTNGGEASCPRQYVSCAFHDYMGDVLVECFRRIPVRSQKRMWTLHKAQQEHAWHSATRLDVTQQQRTWCRAATKDSVSLSNKRLGVAQQQKTWCRAATKDSVSLSNKTWSTRTPRACKALNIKTVVQRDQRAPTATLSC
eukprot:1141730-Pelagomonas_calceolata.AAC.4